MPLLTNHHIFFISGRFRLIDLGKDTLRPRRVWRVDSRDNHRRCAARGCVFRIWSSRHRHYRLGFNCQSRALQLRGNRTNRENRDRRQSNIVQTHFNNVWRRRVTFRGNE